MKNTAIETFCDWGMVFSLCAAIFVLPASIAFLDSFAALAVLFYFFKKISRIVMDWPVRTSSLNLLGKAHFIWKGLAPPENFLNFPLQLLSLAVFVSVVFSQYPALSLSAFMGKFLKCVFLYLSFIEAFNDERRIRIFLKFLLLSAFITVLNGVIQYYTGEDYLKGHLISGGRINSLFFTANGLGAYLLPVIGLVAHSLYTAIARNRSWVLGGALAVFLLLLLACLCWTYSRSSWVGFLAILFVMVLVDRRKALLAAGLLLILIFIFLPSLNDLRHMDLINDKNVTVQNKDIKSFIQHGGSGRLAYWEKAVSVIRSSPIFGTGLNSYTRVIKRDPDQGVWWYAHNCYLQITAETGLVGLACFLWLLFVLLWHGLCDCSRIKDIWPLTVLQGAVSGLCGFLVQSFFDNTFYTVQLGIFMWLIFGLIVAVTRLKTV